MIPVDFYCEGITFNIADFVVIHPDEIFIFGFSKVKCHHVGIKGFHDLSVQNDFRSDRRKVHFPADSHGFISWENMTVARLADEQIVALMVDSHSIASDVTGIGIIGAHFISGQRSGTIVLQLTGSRHRIVRRQIQRGICHLSLRVTAAPDFRPDRDKVCHPGQRIFPAHGNAAVLGLLREDPFDQLLRRDGRA